MVKSAVGKNMFKTLGEQGTERCPVDSQGAKWEQDATRLERWAEAKKGLLSQDLDLILGANICYRRHFSYNNRGII